MGERAHTQFRTRRRHIPRRQIKKIGVFETFSCDLGDLQALKDFNHGMGWLFLAVDNFSKFIFLEAAPTKEKKSMLACFSKMMETIKELKVDLPISHIHSDKGKEYLTIKDELYSKYGINLFTTESGIKSSMSERMLKIVLSKLYLTMYLHNDFNWVKPLKEIESGLNNTIKKSINNMTPMEIVLDKQKAKKLKKFYALETIKHEKKYGKKIWREDDLSIGDSVRYLLPSRNIFQKSYEPAFSDGIFRVTKLKDTAPPVYFIDAPTVKGRSFYRQELSRSWPIERPRKKDLFVASERLIDGRILRSGQKSNQKKQYLLRSRQKNEPGHWIDQEEFDRLKSKKLIET